MSSHSISLTKEQESIAQKAASEVGMIVDDYLKRIIEQHIKKIETFDSTTGTVTEES